MCNIQGQYIHLALSSKFKNEKSLPLSIRGISVPVQSLLITNVLSDIHIDKINTGINIRL